MVIRFCVIPLVAIRLRSTIAILDKNQYRNLGKQEKLVLQATFIVKDINNNNMCQHFYNSRAIIFHIVMSLLAINTIYISDKYLNSRIKKLSNKKVTSYSCPIGFQHVFFEQHVK
jgi:hypothetical protein